MDTLMMTFNCPSAFEQWKASRHRSLWFAPCPREPLPCRFSTWGTNLDILMSKMRLALVDQSLEKSIKSWKKLS